MDSLPPSKSSSAENLESVSTPTPVKKSRRKLILVSLLCLIIIISSVVFLQLNKDKAQTSTPTSHTATYDLKGAVFAQFHEIKSAVKPSLPSYSLKAADLANFTDVVKASNLQLSDQDKASLESPGFFISPTKSTPSDPTQALVSSMRWQRSDDMVDLYRTIGGYTPPWERKPENAVFVTSDFLLHVFHIMVDRTFQKIEEVKFEPTLKQLTDALYTDSLSHYQNETNADLKDSWKRLTIYYLIPKVILDTSYAKPTEYFSSPEEEAAYVKSDETADAKQAVLSRLQTYQKALTPDMYQLAEQELTLVMDADKFNTESPLYTNLKKNSAEDYTQYKPRSHYTRNSVLRNYFRAMMWYGRHSFEVDRPQLTRDALLMTYQMGNTTVGNTPTLKLWEDIYLPTVFFVGRSDDLTLYEYSDVLKKVYGESNQYANFADAKKFTQFQQLAQKLEGPHILSEIKVYEPGKVPSKEEVLQSTKGFRFMGQRFIPDSYMFSSLTQGDEPADPETGQKLPSTPTALMVMSLLGSSRAQTHLNDWIKTEAPNSDKVIAKYMGKLQTEFNSYTEKDWTQNIYWSWLYTLKPLLATHQDGYPEFMKGLAWEDKSLNSALGSWTELRHDSLLYAKQSYAEMGGGGPEDKKVPPVPKGYVEPDLSFLTRLIALTTMTRDGLNSKGLLIAGQKEKFDSYLQELQFFKTIAEKELSNATITDDEYEKLRTTIELTFPDIVWMPQGDTMTEKDARVGIIADVHTDAIKSSVLYEATGVPSVIYVAVKDKGGTRLTRGVVYSYYEFSRPVGNRLSDDDWQGMIYDGKNATDLPTTASWMKPYLKQ